MANQLPKNKQILEKAKKEEKSIRAYSRFVNETNSDDPVTKVLRAHLLAEYYIDQLLIILLPYGNILIDQKFTFYHKINILKALDVLTERDFSSIRALNSLRNDCSHVLSYEIGEKDIDKLGLPFGAKYIDEKDEFSSPVKHLHYCLMRIIATLDALKEIHLSKQKNI